MYLLQYLGRSFSTLIIPLNNSRKYSDMSLISPFSLYLPKYEGWYISMNGYDFPSINISYIFNNGSLKFEITAKRLYAASQRVL